jgi:hypothetical protein
MNAKHTLHQFAARSQLLTTSALSKPLAPQDLPLVQIMLTKEGAPDKTLTLSPIGLRDYFTTCTLEHAHEQPIEDATFEGLAAALGVELTNTLRREIYATIIGTTLMTLRRWYSPRKLAQLLEKLKRDPLQTIAVTRDDTFAEFTIQTIQQAVKSSGRSSHEVIDWHLAAIREAIRRGHPDEEARSIFFEEVVAIAQRRGDKLALPPRDESRGMTNTPLFEFSVAMRDLVIDYSNTMLERKHLPASRFDSFALSRKQLISHLETARKTILREKSNTYS